MASGAHLSVTIHNEDNDGVWALKFRGGGVVLLQLTVLAGVMA
jgi:hypothetical protein